MKMIIEGQILIFDDGIYSYENFETFQNLLNFFNNKEAIDLWCPTCKREKTFNHANSNIIYNLNDKYDNSNLDFFDKKIETYDNIFYKSYICPSCNQKIIYIFKNEQLKVIKIAQYPSLKDVTPNLFKKYQHSKYIDDADLKNMNNAQILSCESFYVASYTYLRRVFENLINRTFQNNIEKYEISVEDFNSKHMNEKVSIIKNELPIDDDIYNVMYKNLSEGIHQLSEEECKNRYEILFNVMVDILDSEIENKAKEERKKKLKQIANTGGADGKS